MKKIVAVIIVFAGLCLTTATASADSPLTSTPFSNAYEDISIVKEAAEKGIVDAGIAAYLSDENNPLDVKAAVINALSWDINGKTNAETYSNLIFQSSLADLDVSSLSGDQLFCFGYLMAMDDYFNTDQALDYLKQAEEKIPDSFTVSIIRALVETMDLSDGGWEEHIRPLLLNNAKIRDMRQEAVNIILDYMALYSTESDLPVSQNSLMIEKDDSHLIYLYGTLSWNNETPYEIVKNSSIADVEIGIDDYGIYYLSITGLENGSSSIEIENSDGKRAVIDIDVIPGAAEASSDIPNTGSESLGVIYGICAAVAAFTAAAAGMMKSRQNVVRGGK